MTWVEPPSDFDPYAMAEFIECELLASEDEHLSQSELSGMFAVGRQPADEDFAFAFAEIERRGREFGKHYPFSLDGRGVRIDRAGEFQLYALLLLLSMRGTEFRRAARYGDADSLFDAVVREAFRAHQGARAKALIFAWPPRSGRPTDFPKAVSWAAEQMGVSLRNFDSIPSHYQDAGVDVIVWKPFTDSRTGFPIFLVQNTIKQDFRMKPRDVSAVRWHTWLAVGAQPSVGFAIPFVVPLGDNWWHDITNEVSVTMDRGRLLESLGGGDPRVWPEWSDLLEFVESQIGDLRSLPSGSAASVKAAKRRRKSPEKRHSVS